MERRLAAVLIADVVGYGRLSQADEEGTRARFQADLHEVFEPKIAAHHGRLFKTMGDGLLVEFHSVVDAVALRGRGAARRGRAQCRPAGRSPIDFRIGINLGDVIVEGDDIHGDGVNIADRLQELAEPGGILISGTAYDQVEEQARRRLRVPRRAAGEEHRRAGAGLPRADDPTAAGKTFGESRARSDRALAVGRSRGSCSSSLSLPAQWRGGVHGSRRSSLHRSQRMALPLPDKPSIAVLPFANMSDDPSRSTSPTA